MLSQTASLASISRHDAASASVRHHLQRNNLQRPTVACRRPAVNGAALASLVQALAAAANGRPALGGAVMTLTGGRMDALAISQRVSAVIVGDSSRRTGVVSVTGFLPWPGTSKNRSSVSQAHEKCAMVEQDINCSLT
jgi:hypothetical protein